MSRPVHALLLAGLTGAAACSAPAAVPPPHHPGAHAAQEHPHQHGHAHHRFEDAASWSKVFDDPARDAWQKPGVVVAALGLRPGMTVADVGAGTGYFEPHLARAVGKDGVVLAVDIEPDMVRWIGERAVRDGTPNVKASLGTAADPGLPEGAVDRVLVVDTWHHVADRGAYARKLARSLRKGGFVAIVDFTKASPHGPPPAHRIAPEEVVAELAAAGLRAGSREVDLPYQYLVIGERAE